METKAKAKPKAKPKAKTAVKPAPPPATPYPVKVTEAKAEWTPPPTAPTPPPKPVIPSYTIIPELRFTDEAGNIYQLDHYMARGTYILRTLSRV
jgi:hypothetical protein